jgi:CO/xanthine dehydrogenase Mo-binding subunit
VLPQKAKAGVDPKVGEPLQPLQDDRVHYHGQPVAVVVADTLERATYAATLVRLEYREEKAVLDFPAAAKRAQPPRPPKSSDRVTKKPSDYVRGDPDKALAAAEVNIEQTYTIPAEYHNPMEMHATVAGWEGDKLTLYDKTQWVDNVQAQVAAAFGIPVENVRVLSPFVGGAFGSALRAWVHVFITALAARQVRRPVKLMLTRGQMYTVPGYRPHTVQKVALRADRTGKLTAIRHEGTGQTSTYEEYTESLLNPTRFLYACPNVGTRYRLAAMNVNTPASMRGPGEASGVYALECALDELAYALKMDPVELRLLNYADNDPQSGKPWSSKSLKECYQQGAEKFGWARRKPAPRSMRDGRLLLGYGMATATWPTLRRPATVRVRIHADGSADVRTAASDIGPGTYTVMTQIAADALGLPVSRVRFELGDSRMPQAPVQGGSMTVASVGSAVHEAAVAAGFAPGRGSFLSGKPRRELDRGQSEHPRTRSTKDEGGRSPSSFLGKVPQALSQHDCNFLDYLAPRFDRTALQLFDEFPPHANLLGERLRGESGFLAHGLNPPADSLGMLDRPVSKVSTKLGVGDGANPVPGDLDQRLTFRDFEDIACLADPQLIPVRQHKPSWVAPSSRASSPRGNEGLSRQNRLHSEKEVIAILEPHVEHSLVLNVPG